LVALAVFVLAGVVGLIRVPPSETAAVARDLLFAGAGWLVALAAAMLPAGTTASRSDRACLPGVSAALVVLAATGVAQAWFGWEGLPQAAPPAGTFVNRNVAAQTLVALIPLAFCGVVSGTTRRARWGAGLVTGLGLAFLVATRSRGAWLGLAVGSALGLLAFAMASRRRGEMPDHRRIVGPALLIAALLAASLLAPIGADAKGSVGATIRSLSAPASGTGAVRLAFWSNGLELLRDEPLLGVGAGRFAVVYPLYQRSRMTTPGFGTWLQVDHAHGDLLEFAIEFGLPAAMALLFLFVGAISRSIRSIWRAESVGPRTEATLVAAALSGILVHGLLSFPLHSPASGFLAWFLIGRSWATDGDSPQPLRARPVILTLALVLLLVGAWIGAREIESQRALSFALRAHAAKACPDAIKGADRARSAAPWQRRESGMAAMVRFECDRDAARSLHALEPALAIQPNQLNLLLATGARRLKNGDASRGAEAFRRSVRISPELGRGWLGLAMCLDAIGERDEAAMACRRALDLLPGMRQAEIFCGGNGYR
jgi:O-antigen ligase